MDKLIEKFRKKIAQTDIRFSRSLMNDIAWNSRLIGIKGARGIGKTTLILQYIKLHLRDELESVLYVSLDDIWFSEHRLVNLAENFVKHGGKYLFLDEVHKYPQWSVEIKNLYDDYPELKIIFTGSSLLEILNARADLSRRAVIYTMQGLSFREYLNMVLGTDFNRFLLPEILDNHLDISTEILHQIKPLQYFPHYLNHGYYPFFSEGQELYHIRLAEIINMVLEVELPLLRNVNIAYVNKIKQLLYIISESSPFIPNISKLSERIGINRETLLSYLHYLNEAHILFSLYKEAHGISLLQKPDKIYLDNSNLMYALSSQNADKGNVRETFFANQLHYKHEVTVVPKGDFHIDNEFIFEIGGQNKSCKQIKSHPNAFIAADGIEYGFKNKIPLWMFGFLY